MATPLMSHADRIQELLVQKPGLRAQQIATELGLERSEVSATLHGLMRGEVIQDNAYRWWPKKQPLQKQVDLNRPAPATFIGSLCRYYLECLSRESDSGISLPAAASGTDYVALSELPFIYQSSQGGLTPQFPPGDQRAIRILVRKVQRERGQLALYIGYAVRIRRVRSASEDEMRIEPLLLYPVEDMPVGADPIQPATGIPLFNTEVLKNPPSVDSGNVIDEAIQLAEELGLANAEDELPSWDEIILRLQHCRPEWDWREDLNPWELSRGESLAALKAPGIYNRAVLFAGTRSPFTYGLETELRKLASLDDAAIRDTALGLFLRGENIDASAPEDRPVLEILPMNAEQRQAVVQGLQMPLTVVTGPPGTGKSQVVISLLANMAWQGGSVLFSSKNNHAIDVVESRVNELGPDPLLLRLGREDHQLRVAQHLTASLAESSSPDDTARCARLTQAWEESRRGFAAVQSEIGAVVNLRNKVDQLERAAEPARSLFDEAQFGALRRTDLESIRQRIESLAQAIAAARKPGPMAKVRVFGLAKPDRIAGFANELESAASLLGVSPPQTSPDETSLQIWEAFHDALADRLEWATRVQNYLTALDRLRSSKSLESLARDLGRIAEESARDSLELWQSWLRSMPSRWNPAERKLLAEYVALLQMISSGDRFDEGAGRQVFRRYYNVFPKVTKILPCWAVTSLSARGRLPFEPGFFDLVVIDEASQCDIASALPLLFRAKRAMIIGDPRQLQHVSTVAPQQDRLFLSAHGLAEGRAAWAYSINSLFDLARSLCRHEDIVNLRDHHRSHRDIITFSNRHFYRGSLRIATDHESLKRPLAAGAAVRWTEIKGKVIRPSGGGALNNFEAEAVVAELRELILEQGYIGGIGVVTPFRAQANRIRTLVHQDQELSRRLASLQFVVDTVHGFQGDERDVIFFSPVVSAGAGESTLRFLKSHGNLFNVAITRARSELVVVGDRQAALDSGVNYLASFAEYTRDLVPNEMLRSPSDAAGPEYPPTRHPELVSIWERTFYQALFNAGIRPVPQYEEAPYILDFALFNGTRKLDIEVDGENYHRNWDGDLCRRDQIRSRRLNDLGWDVMRFWVYEIRDDLEGSVARIRAWIANGASGL